MGTESFGIHTPTLDALAGQLAIASELGTEIAIVIGGGNIFRGLKGSAAGREIKAKVAEQLGLVQQRQFLEQFPEQLQELHPSWRQQHHLQFLDLRRPYLQQFLRQHQD